MTRKIFLNSFIVGLIVLLLCSVLFFGLQYTQTQTGQYQTLQQETDYVIQGLNAAGTSFLEGLDSPNRITLISPDGTVIYDTEPDTSLSNQLDCAEIIEAIKNGSGETIRKSESSGESTLYYAKAMDNGNIIRMEHPNSAAKSALITISPVMWVAVLVTLLSGVFSFKVSRKMLKPVNDIDLDNPDLSKTYQELAPLVSRIQEQNLTIKEQMDELHRRQKEFLTLTDSMSEGFILTDKKGIILSANNSSLRLFPVAEVGSDLLDSTDKELKKALRDALDGKRSDTLISMDGRSWQLIASPVLSHRQVSGAVILIMDVTEREQRERLRQEFSANVSHELKTPLTSISGFAELMMGGMVPQEKMTEFAGDIYHESSRLIALVDDIIKLSKLDEDTAIPPEETVDLYDVASDTIDSLKAVAEKQGITVKLTGEHIQIKGVWQLLGEMVYNICDNAIKYNRPGGSVTVDVTGGEGYARLSVTDTGIGIPYPDQSRVFERFYRVDKSHSKEIGGTGLGLSIVKHGAQYHNAQVTLESTPDVGTTVSLIFTR